MLMKNACVVRSLRKSVVPDIQTHHGKGQERGVRGYSKNLTSVLIKRLLTTSFSVYANNNKKGFYNIGFPETQKYFKAIVVKPGHSCFHLHQSIFKVQV